METLLLVINIILAVILVLLILLQKSEGGALGIGVSQENFMLSRSAVGFMTKATAIVVRGTLDAKPNQSVLSPGDIVSVGTVQRLWETFDSPNGLELVTIYNIFS